MAEAQPSRRERQRADTRAELLAAAHELVRNDGYDGLTIRKLAEKVGYAPMSVYSYFADKQAILVALAEDTFEILARRIQENQPADPIEALRFGLMEYAAFGLDNANEYRTIFMSEKLHEDHEASIEQLRATNPAFLGLQNGVIAGIESGQLKGDVHTIATMLWTVAHGAVSLVLTFPKYPFGDPLAYAGQMVDFTLAALQRETINPLPGAAADRAC